MKTSVRHNTGKLYVAIVVATLVVLFTAPALHAQEEHMMPASPNVTYTSGDGVETGGYLATPPRSGPHPAVLMIHEWWGLNVDVTRLADALAAEGYVVLAPDAFRGSLAQTPQEAMAQLRSTPQEQIAMDLDAAIDFLKSHQAVDADRVATLGFCFGGTQSMHLGTRTPGLAAVVTLYGSGPIQDADALGMIPDNEPVLGIFGEEDGSIPISEVNGFESALNARNVDNTISVYPGVGHAFVKSTTYNQGGAPEAAWNELVAFFNDTLQ
ncbi:MAG: dienelactone hydrolase family protein [Spirochaeta sp.]|jgi:carboxymethylenebutenolidase|nr:dienelactone hydrolase family protein [Spirochaeta sp.]